MVHNCFELYNFMTNFIINFDTDTLTMPEPSRVMLNSIYDRSPSAELQMNNIFGSSTSTIKSSGKKFRNLANENNIYNK